MMKQTFSLQSLMRHVVFWVLCWMVLSIEDYAYYPHLFQNFLTNFINTLLFIPVVYLNLTILTPSFLQQKRIVTYALISLAASAATVTIANYIQFLFFSVSYYLSLQAFIAAFTELLVLYTFTTILKFIQTFYRSEAALRELKMQNLEMELNLLKSQVNPHFLFNTLNNLYFLIPKKGEQAQEVVLKLSDLLSHQLYDNGKALITLQKEVENLKNYIELEKLRTQDCLALTYEFPQKINGERIAPMLLLPLLENAFKHGGAPTNTLGYVTCNLKVEHHTLYFHCKNSFVPKSVKAANMGIGLKNVQRRLELLYPKRHELNVTLSEVFFELNLKLNLNEN